MLIVPVTVVTARSLKNEEPYTKIMKARRVSDKTLEYAL